MAGPLQFRHRYLETHFSHALKLNLKNRSHLAVKNEKMTYLFPYIPLLKAQQYGTCS